MGNWAWGIGDWALGMGHWAWGIVNGSILILNKYFIRHPVRVRLHKQSLAT